jgi:hypothetical protein
MEMKNEERFAYMVEWHAFHTAALKENSILTPEFIRAYTTE